MKTFWEGKPGPLVILCWGVHRILIPCPVIGYRTKACRTIHDQLAVIKETTKISNKRSNTSDDETR